MPIEYARALAQIAAKAAGTVPAEPNAGKQARQVIRRVSALGADPAHHRLKRDITGFGEWPDSATQATSKIMGKLTGFLEFERADRKYKPVEERVKHWQEFVVPLSEAEAKTQAARCMDCGIPYCHNGCPVNNQIPDWNDLVYQRRLEDGGRQPALDQQLPRGDGPHLPCPVRSLVHAQHRRQRRSPSRRSSARSPIARGTKAGSCRSRRRRRPARRSPSSAPVLLDLPPPSNSREPGTMSMSMRRTRSRAGCWFTASPTSRWRKGSSRAA